VILPQNSENTSLVVEMIARGGIIAFRTDTFYGLGADPFNASAVQKVKDLKGREEDKPILVLISDVEQLDRLIENRSSAFDELAKDFWPGALTIIGEAIGQLARELTAGTKTVGVRLPDDDRVRALVRACGGALTATSANPSGEPPARTAEEVANYFADGIDLIVNGGAAETDQPSTVVDATGAGSAGILPASRTEVRLVRQGSIAWSEIQSALSEQ
jgi:L-threonylcarbamoyladenylate synthase